MNIYKRYKAVRIMVKIIMVIVIFLLIAILFMRFYPTFGSRPTKADREDYAKRAENFDGKKFTYPNEWVIEGVSADNRVSVKGTVPENELPTGTPDILDEPGEEYFGVTWLGHSSLLIQMHGKNILIDPVFSQRSSPFQFVGPKRFTQPPLTIGGLPHIDVVLITHDHYDHLDMTTIKALEAKTDLFAVPLGIDKHIARWIDDDSKLKNLAWWESFDLDGLEIYCTPANHKSGRGMLDQQNTLFCSWVFKDEYHQVFESGDTGYGGHFEAIHERYGDFDLVMTDGAQYDMNWHYWHMLPEESAMAAETLGAKAVMPVHWGAFVLSSHGWDDPPERLTAACEERGMTVVTPKLGETMVLDSSSDYQERWWREYK